MALNLSENEQVNKAILGTLESFPLSWSWAGV